MIASAPELQSDSLTVLQVNTQIRRGGAAAVVGALHDELLTQRVDSHVVVGRPVAAQRNVHQMPNAAERGIRARWLGAAADSVVGDSRFSRRLSRALRFSADPARFRDRRNGVEDFHQPGTWKLLDMVDGRVDVVNLHNLHGNYFDLNALPWLSHAVPTVLTLHDSWLLTGHCAHSLDCSRWRQGCGACPDLTLPPAIAADSTAENWSRKQDIYSRSRVYVTTPCHWLMSRVRESVLAPAVVEERVIPLGVDLEVFRPGDRAAIRQGLGIDQSARLVVMAADLGRLNPWKDFESGRRALLRAGGLMPASELLFVAPGGEGSEERTGNVTLRFLPYEEDPTRMAAWYQAADLYLHPARADTFPLAVLEAMACGTPVVASDVGGISEQLSSARHGSSEGATGILVPAGDSDSMADAIHALLTDQDMAQSMGSNAANRARTKFDQRRYATEMVDWYREIAVRRSAAASAATVQESGHR